jgi:hypothetical protein
MKNRWNKIQRPIVAFTSFASLSQIDKFETERPVPSGAPALEVEFVYAEALGLPWRLRIAWDVMVSVWCHKVSHEVSHIVTLSREVV